MGKATSRAVFKLDMSADSEEMTGVLLVAEPNSQYVVQKHSFQWASNEHAEIKAMQWLSERYGGEELPNLSDDAKIIFVCNWSPCKQCTEHTIPGWLSMIKLSERNIRVKFRFRDVYCRGAYKGRGSEQYVWMARSTAMDAYRDLENTYGVHSEKFHPESTDSDGITYGMVRTKLKLVFDVFGDHKTSTAISFSGMLID
jgi:hypothetical protein